MFQRLGSLVSGKGRSTKSRGRRRNKKVTKPDVAAPAQLPDVDELRDLGEDLGEAEV